MKKIRISVLLILLILSTSIFTVGCGNDKEMKSTITIAAATSLQTAMEEKIVPAFNAIYPNIKVQSTYDSSGKLQTQIEEGATVDLFFSAALEQMNALIDGGYVKKEEVVNLLENEIVLVGGMNDESTIFNKFADISKAETIAIGDPESVPAGQYAKESLTNLGLWNAVMSKTVSLGTNVSQVVGWVAEGSAQVGIIYKSDAIAAPSRIKIIAKAPDDSVSKCIYPVAVLSGSKEVAATNLFIDFLKSDEALSIFKTYGFKIAE